MVETGARDLDTGLLERLELTLDRSCMSPTLGRVFWTSRKRTLYREACLGCALLVVEAAVPDPRASPLVDSHAHDGRFGLPGHDLVYSSKASSCLRCAVDGRRVRQGARCHFAAGDSRLIAALERAEAARRPGPDSRDDA